MGKRNISDFKKYVNGNKPRNKVAVTESITYSEDFDSVPVQTICNSISLLINNLISRGFPVYDFDNKDKTVKQVTMIGGKVYFLVTEDKESVPNE